MSRPIEDILLFADKAKFKRVDISYYVKEETDLYLYETFAKFESDTNNYHEDEEDKNGSYQIALFKKEEESFILLAFLDYSLTGFEEDYKVEHYHELDNENPDFNVLISSLDEELYEAYEYLLILNSLVVSEEYRGKGIGSWILNYLIQKAFSRRYNNFAFLVEDESREQLDLFYSKVFNNKPVGQGIRYISQEVKDNLTFHYRLKG